MRKVSYTCSSLLASTGKSSCQPWHGTCGRLKPRNGVWRSTARVAFLVWATKHTTQRSCLISYDKKTFSECLFCRKYTENAIENSPTWRFKQSTRWIYTQETTPSSIVKRTTRNSAVHRFTFNSCSPWSLGEVIRMGQISMLQSGSTLHASLAP
jgi:hypothetical protein